MTGHIGVGMWDFKLWLLNCALLWSSWTCCIEYQCLTNIYKNTF